MGKAERYKERAESMRKLAEGLPDSNSKRMILSIARSYGHLAEMIEGDDTVRAADVATAPPESAPIAALKKPDDDSADNSN